MKTLDYFVAKYKIDLRQPSPILLPAVDRMEMALAMTDLGFTNGAEVGTAAGDHALLLCQNIPNLTLYCVDPWEQVDGFISFKNSKLSEWHNQAVDKLSVFPSCHLVQMISMDAVKEVQDKSLDFVYIDGAHDFRHVSEDISEWIKKIKPGGILYGHDYVTIPYGRYACHVKDVVDAYCRSHWIPHWFMLGNLEQRADGKYARIPNWMFVVE